MNWPNNHLLTERLGNCATWMTEFTLCGTLLMLLVLAVGWLLRNRNATVKHAVYTTGLIGLLSLPAFLLALPHWTVSTNSLGWMPLHAAATQETAKLELAAILPTPMQRDDSHGVHADHIERNHASNFATHAPLAALPNDIT